ncbi:Tetraspanin-8 [Lathyrus oleraceus]|uniref:Tetraspanin-8 n=1 Tax=Pisum sativum TaxID=3888 RepID=A0A9D4VWD5_PEA|nr:Tetraspanin-8 [Pisum sativum]
MGVWLHKQSTTECERFLEKPIIALGVFLLVVSLMGLIGACCRVSWLLWFYLLVMFLLIVLLFAFTIFAFVVTNKGAGEALSNRGYKEYRLGDYSNWLQNKVTNGNTWERIRGCLESGKLCSEYHFKFLNDNIEKFHAEQLSALQTYAKNHNDTNLLVEVMKLLKRNDLPLQPGTTDIVFSICYNTDEWELINKYAKRFVKAGVKLRQTSFDTWMRFAAKRGAHT